MKFNSSTGIVRLTTRGVRKQINCVKTFYNEYTVLQKLQYIPGVIKLLDANTDKGHLYLEYHERTLYNYIIDSNKIVGYTKSKKNYIQESMTIFNKILPILHECHNRYYIHGDIKPENILLNNKVEPILIDFGQANYFKNNNRRENTLGTLGYCPPELEQNIVGPFTDVYSLGITLYETLMCKNPHILADGSIDFNFEDGGNECISHQTANMICDMTEPYYENRPTIEIIMNEYPSVFEIKSLDE